ncbi:MAG: RNA polymerase sigma factor [Patescibacteria group bacterium]
MTPADGELIAQSKLGDREAFAELVRRYYARIYGFAFRLLHQREEAQDVTQEVFLRVFRSLDRYVPSQPFTAWIYTIANNLCIDLARRRRHKTVSLSAATGTEEARDLEITDNSKNPELLFANAEIGRTVAEAIASLPYKYRVVTVLRHLQGLSYQEISAITGQPEGTVKAQIFRARRILREKLRQVG